MLDVHILISDHTPSDWWRFCLASVDMAVSQAGFPIAVHPTTGIPGEIGLARARGYALGDFEYKTYVDDDDFLLPHAYAAMKSALESGALSIYGRELQYQNGRLVENHARHGTHIHHISHLVDHAALGNRCDVHQRQQEGIDVKDFGYVYRVYDSIGRKLR